MAIDIRGILEAYKTRLRAPQKTVVLAVVDAYKANGLVNVTEVDVTYTPNSRVVVVKAGGPKKIEMLLRKDAVLRDVKTHLSERDAPLDII